VKKPVGPRHRRTAGSSPEDGEFVAKHDDFQFLEIVRPKAQGRQLQTPAKHQVSERNTKPPVSPDNGPILRFSF
jgi:hypothetical protein